MKKSKKGLVVMICLALALVGVGCIMSLSGCTKKENPPNNGSGNNTGQFVDPLPNGHVVYFNPETGQACTESDYNTNKGASDTGNKSGCMKWYVFNDDGGDTVNLLLDHNTTRIVAWGSNPGKPDGQPDLIVNQLLLDVKGWADDVKATARLITANEIAQITGNIDFDSAKEEIESFYFGGSFEIAENDFGWLYENLPSIAEDIPAPYYWTSSFRFVYNYDEPFEEYDIVDDEYVIIDSGIRDNHYWKAWTVCNGGFLSETGDVKKEVDVGIRPVINVLRKKF